MNEKNHWKLASLALIVIALMSGCAANKAEPSDKFLAPISDQTMNLIGDVEFGLKLADSVLLNHYYHGDTPKVDAWNVSFNDLQSAMRSIVYFSADLVDLAEGAEGPEAIEPLIAIVATLESEIRALPSAQPWMSDVTSQTVFQSMRQKDNITSAIRSAQPLMLEMSGVINNILEANDDALIEAIVELFDLIDANHAPMLLYGENLTARQNAILGQLAIMDRVWEGDDVAWTELLASEWALPEELGKNARLSPDTARHAETLLISRLESVATIRQHLEPAMITYQNELAELYEIEEHVESMLRLSLLLIGSWEKAQAQLASGEKGAFVDITGKLMKIAYARSIRR